MPKICSRLGSCEVLTAAERYCRRHGAKWIDAAPTCVSDLILQLRLEDFLGLVGDRRGGTPAALHHAQPAHHRGQVGWPLRRQISETNLAGAARLIAPGAVS